MVDGVPFLLYIALSYQLAKPIHPGTPGIYIGTCIRPSIHQPLHIDCQLESHVSSSVALFILPAHIPTLGPVSMSRKGVGLAAFDRSRLTSAQYASHGSTLRTTDAAALETQLAVFRSLAQQFAQTHAKDIRSDPSFRAQFARMCAAIGVDPLASSSVSGGGSGGSSSVWAQLLGRSVNDFYFELAVRVVEVCGETRGENGGLIEVRKVRERIVKSRVEGASDITE